MSSKLLLVSEVFAEAGQAAVAAKAWAAQQPPAVVQARTVYEAIDGSSALELVAVPCLGSIAQLSTWWRQCWEAVGAHLHGDFRRQLLEFIEAPKDTADLLPTTPYIQMRHVEVRPPAHNDYLAWRDRTIFEVVRNADEVDVFLAYHSVISTEPGVMFVSGFSCEVDAYTTVFTSTAYQDIVRQAGDQFITDGERGLYTKIYRRIAD